MPRTDNGRHRASLTSSGTRGRRPSADHRVRRRLDRAPRGDTVRFRLTTHPDQEHDRAVRTWVSERTADPAT